MSNSLLKLLCFITYGNYSKDFKTCILSSIYKIVLTLTPLFLTTSVIEKLIENVEVMNLITMIGANFHIIIFSHLFEYMKKS